jgi:hypothetical protein
MPLLRVHSSVKPSSEQLFWYEVQEVGGYIVEDNLMMVRVASNEMRRNLTGSEAIHKG